MGHWFLVGKRWPKRYAAPRVLSWPMDPRNREVYGRAAGRIVLVGDPKPKQGLAPQTARHKADQRYLDAFDIHSTQTLESGPLECLASVADAWPRAPFWDAVADLNARPDLRDPGAAARARLALEGVGLADEHLAREIIGRLLGRAPQDQGLQPIWTLFDSLSPGDLSQRIEHLSDEVVAENLPPGWDLARYRREVDALAEQRSGRQTSAERPDRARRAGVTWADYWQASAVLGLPVGKSGEAEQPGRDPSEGLLKCCALVWEAGWRGSLDDLEDRCDAARLSRCGALRTAVAAAWFTFVEWSPADKADLARRAHEPPARPRTSPPILKPGHLLSLAWEARKSRWLRREPDYFQDACDRAGVREDREMREAIGRNWRRLDPGFFRMADPSLGPPPRPAYP